MNDEQRLLASAALDGAVTSEERARAEADPEVVAEIERLRAVRAALQVDIAPDAERREASIAAALAAFDVAPAAPSLAARRRQRWMAPLAAAAAVAVIAVGAVAVMRGGGGGDDTATEPLNATPSAAGEGGAVEQESAPAAAPTAADERDLMAEAPAGTEAAAADAAEATELPLTGVVLRSPAELADFALGNRAAAEGDLLTDSTCELGTPRGTAHYLLDGTPVLVEVYETADPHEAVAVAIDGCVIVASAPLP